jgi:hypothetical protein
VEPETEVINPQADATEFDASGGDLGLQRGRRRLVEVVG